MPYSGREIAVDWKCCARGKSPVATQSGKKAFAIKALVFFSGRNLFNKGECPFIETVPFHSFLYGDRKKSLLGRLKREIEDPLLAGSQWLYLREAFLWSAVHMQAEPFFILFFSFSFHFDFLFQQFFSLDMVDLGSQLDCIAESTDIARLITLQVCTFCRLNLWKFAELLSLKKVPFRCKLFGNNSAKAGNDQHCKDSYFQQFELCL